MQWTIVIPTRHGGPRLARTVSSLEPVVGPRDEIVVVRDDPKCEVPGSVVGCTRVETWRGIRGFAVACNHGARMARGRRLLFLNDDVVACDPQMLDALDEALGLPDVAMAGPDVRSERLGRSESGTAVFWHHGVLESRQEVLEGEGIIRVPFVCGAALAVSRDTFFALGGFDERLVPYYWEDVSLALRARRRGMDAVVVADISVLHEHGATIAREDPALRRAVYERNRMLVSWEHLHGARWAGHASWAALRFLKSAVREPAVARGILAAVRMGMARGRGDAGRA